MHPYAINSWRQQSASARQPLDKSIHTIVVDSGSKSKYSADVPQGHRATHSPKKGDPGFACCPDLDEYQERLIDPRFKTTKSCEENVIGSQGDNPSATCPMLCCVVFCQRQKSIQTANSYSIGHSFRCKSRGHSPRVGTLPPEKQWKIRGGDCAGFTLRSPTTSTSPRIQ